jgi:stress-induced-phosphoprotein 1
MGAYCFSVPALEAYKEALKVEPNNAQAKAGLAAVDEAIRRESEENSDADFGFGKMFSDPNLLSKLASNPKTAPLLADPEFIAKLNRLSKNPSAIQSELQDPRMIQVFAAILGAQIGEMPTTSGGNADTEMPDYKTASPPMEPTPEPEDEEAIAKRQAKTAADKEKELGTQSYKKRQFDVAIGHYSKAWELFKDITYLNNLAAAKYEAGDFEGCIAECQTAIEEGREMRADFKLIAKQVFSHRNDATSIC